MNVYLVRGTVGFGDLKRSKVGSGGGGGGGGPGGGVEVDEQTGGSFGLSTELIRCRACGDGGGGRAASELSLLIMAAAEPVAEPFGAG